jgi:FKBP-type peptidyl-prolyl cis-trans isomerase
MGSIAVADRDTVSITYRVTNIAGEEVDLLENRADTLRSAVRGLIPGLKEGVTLVGEGGSVTLWIPSSQAYGSAGDADKGIKANEMLRYEVNIIEVKHRR